MKEAESFRLQGNDERENEDALRGSGATFYFKCTNLSWTFRCTSGRLSQTMRVRELRSKQFAQQTMSYTTTSCFAPFEKYLWVDRRTLVIEPHLTYISVKRVKQ